MLSLVITTMSMTAVSVPLVVSGGLIFRVGGVVNSGSGYFCVFACAACASRGSRKGPVGVVLTLPAGAVLGALTYAVAVLPAQRGGVPVIGLTMSTLGFGSLLSYPTRRFLGGRPSIAQPWPHGSVSIGGVQTASQRLLIIALALLVPVLLYALFDRTLIGRGRHHARRAERPDLGRLHAAAQGAGQDRRWHRRREARPGAQGRRPSRVRRAGPAAPWASPRGWTAATSRRRPSGSTARRCPGPRPDPAVGWCGGGRDPAPMRL